MLAAALPAARSTAPTYARHRPETTTLYEVVRDNLDTLYGAIDDGALAVRVPKHARKELEAYLSCGVLCRGFARLRCGSCSESLLVAFACKGRGFCPSCMGRRMCATAANLMERVLPGEAALRQWVLTFPFPWRPILARDGALLGELTRIFVESVQRFYVRRADESGGKTGAITVVQRTSSDVRLHPHLHTLVLDGVYREESTELVWYPTGHLQTREGCPPVVLPGHKGSRIALGPDGRVFVARPEGGNISMSRDASTPGAPLVDEAPLGDALPEELAMAADTTHLYFGMAGEVRRVHVDGGPWETFAAGQGTVSGLVVRSGWVYWLSVEGGALRRRRAAGGSVASVVEGRSAPRLLVASSAELFWIEPALVGAPVFGLAWPDGG